MNCLNTVGAGININKIGYVPPETPAVTISGSGAYTRSPTGTTFTKGTKYTYTFTGGTNTFNCNFRLESIYVIVVGGGGDASVGSGIIYSPGGAGGGTGALTMSYIETTSCSITVARASSTFVNGATASSSSFLINSKGVTSTGGVGGARQSSVAPAGGSSSCSLPGTFVSATGGNGGLNYNKVNTIGVGNGGDSSGVTVNGTFYRYGGGGKAGYAYNVNGYGGKAGSNGVGATSYRTSGQGGESATTPGSGAGGGAYSDGASQTYGKGGRGEVIITFTYPY